jgi:predicted permease
MTQPVARTRQENSSFSFIEVADYRGQSKTIDEFVEYGDWQFNVVGLGEPRLIYGGLVTSNYFKVLAIRPLFGRSLVAEDDRRGAPAVAVLTYEFWRTTFGDDRRAVGKVIELTGVPTQIVGVLEPGSHYAGTQRAELYANYSTNSHYMSASMQNERPHRMTDVYALVKPGVTLTVAQSEIGAIADRLHQAYPKDYPPASGYAVRLTPWRDVLVKNARPTLLILMGAVALVLVVACANVGNLTLARLVRREHEMTVRAALGASARSLRLQLLAEHLVLALAGSVLGIGIAALAQKLLVDYTARFTLRADAVNMNGIVLAFSLFVGLTAAVLFAWMPRLPSDEKSSLLAGSASTRTTQSRGQRAAQGALVVAQIAVSFVVLVGAGLLVRTFANLQGVAPGFDPTQVLSLRAPNVMQLSAEKNRQLFEDVITKLRSYPGVVAVAGASRVPFAAGEVLALNLKTDRGPFDGTTAPLQMLNLTVSPAYFETLKITPLRGRVFAAEDRATSQRVVLINEAMAKTAFGAEDPVGRTVDWSFNAGQFVRPRLVVGVVRDVHELGGAGMVVPTVYESSVQAAPGSSLLVRTTGDPALVAREAARLIHEIDPKRPVVDVRTLESAASEKIAPSRLNATLFGGFALLALAIAAVGIGGVLAFSVSQRTREFGVRMALGSGRGRILYGVLGEGLVLAGIGVVGGTAAALALSNLLSTLLFGVAALDWVTFVATAIILIGVAAAAAWIPAHRATRVDPNVALRTN